MVPIRAIVVKLKSSSTRPEVGIRIMCYLCEWKNTDGADLRVVWCDFVSAVGNISAKSRRMCVCQNCRSRSLYCSDHLCCHAVFIDSSHACPQCIREESRLRLKDRRDSLHRVFHKFMRHFSEEEKHAFYSLVRRAIGDAGGKKSSPLMCFIVAMVAKANCWQMSFEEILEMVKAQGTLVALLPQAAKRYKLKVNPS